MATITTEFGKLSSKKTRTVYLRIRQNGSERRINTLVKVREDEISHKTKKIKTISKAQKVEEMKMELLKTITAIKLDFIGRKDLNANYIANKYKSSDTVLDFFVYAEKWIKESSIKGKKNYNSALNALESYLGNRHLPFSDITVSLLKNFETFLADKPRAQSLYLGAFRHLYLEAMKEYNTEDETVITKNPFLRYNVPKQDIKLGVRSLTLKDIIKIFNYIPLPGSRAEQAKDCFIMSFCLMGMNSVDFYNAEVIQNDVIKYNRTKTKDRRIDKAYIEVKIHPFIKKLVKKYRGTDKVFSFSKRYADEMQFNRALNIGLKEVGTAVNIKKLEFYQARHTFATLSRNLMKFSKSDVDEALNHIGGYAIADIYIKKDFTIINENNFKLIETVFNEFIEKRSHKSKAIATNAQIVKNTK